KRGKRRWIFRKPTIHETTILHNQEAEAATNNTTSSTSQGILATNLLPQHFDLKQREAIAVATPTTLTAVKYTQAAVDIVRLTGPTVLVNEERAILIIQTAFRGYLSTNQASTADDGYDHLHALEKIEDLLQKAKEAAKKRENTLAHAFSRKMWTSNKDEDMSTTKEVDKEDLRVVHVKNYKNLSRRDCIKNIEMDTACSYSDSDTEFWRLHHQYYQEQQNKFYSYANINGLPMTPPLKMKNILVHSASPRCRKEEKSRLLFRNSCPAADHQPNYMAATASARARERSQSAPRQIPMTPEREKTSAAKKHLSFPVQ
ncbi:hypothetical protein HAX54_043388, partial [Datura stramonium]|nr:hypothetical protein [Datura stramonium]